MQGLEGLRVVELGEMVAAAYAGKLIADLGGDVVKVEPPSGDRARMRGPFPSHVRSDQGRHDASGLYLYLNTNKRSVVLDLATPRGREQLDQLIEGADLVIHNLPRAAVDALGLAPEALLAQWPALVVCSITPFGLEGPYSRYRAEEITTSHAGGWAALTPGACEHPDAPPLKTFGHQADFQAATAGAAAAVAACLRALRTGQGEAIDLCSQAHIAGMLEAGFITETYRGETPTRFGRRTLNPWKIFECRDGLIFLATIEQDQWERLVAFMGNPDWTQLEVFADFPGRMQNVDLVESMIQEWIATWRVDDLYHEGQKHRICFAPVLSLAELAQQDQLAERDFFVTVDHPVAGPLPHLAAPYRLGEAWWKLRTPAPRLGEHDAEVLGEGDAENPVAADNQRAWRTPRSVAMPDRPSPRAGSEHPADRPLEGVRVLDFSWVWAGPYCAMQLAHLGAEVIKIESEARPDLGRRLPFFPPDTPRTLDASGYFNQWNQGKRSVRLDLSQEPAREIARAIASPLRRRGRQLLARCHDAPRPRSRKPACKTSRHHHGIDLGVWADGAAQPLHGLRSRDRAARRPFLAHGLSGRATPGARHCARRSDGRHSRGLCDRCGTARTRANRGRSTHRRVTLGGHGRGSLARGGWSSR